MKQKVFTIFVVLAIAIMLPGAAIAAPQGTRFFTEARRPGQTRKTLQVRLIRMAWSAFASTSDGRMRTRL